jgi:DNA-binding PadR family transcriptional regulator
MDLIDLLSRADDWRVDGRFPRASELTFKSPMTVTMAYRKAVQRGLLERTERGQYELTQEGEAEIRRWRSQVTKNRRQR